MVSVAQGFRLVLLGFFGMSDRLVYLLAAGVVACVRRLPLSVCFVLGQTFGALLWIILPGYRRLARENLERAFGKGNPELKGLVFRHFTTLGANAVCAFKMPALTQDEINRVAVIERLDRIQTAIAAGRPVVLAINHIGNWELYAQLVFRVPEARFGTVYQALRNPLVDDLVNRDRRRLGVQTFDRKKGFTAALALLREPGIVGVLVDQHAGDGGMWTPFFGRLASTSTLAATLALRTGAVVIPVAIHTAGFAKWRVVLSEEVPWSEDAPEKLTADLNLVLERQIRESPQDWFWVHNRWKLPLPNFLCASAKRGVHVPPDAKLEPLRIVVRSPNWLGDAVMAAPTVQAFAEGRPDARVTVLTPKKLADFWKRVAGVSGVLEISRRESVWATAAKLRGRFDVAVLLPNSLRSALEAWLAGVPRRVGYAGHRRTWLLNQTIPEPKKATARPAHHADRYWRIAKRCGATEQSLPPAQWTLPAGDPVIALCPGAEYGPAKRWPAERFREVIEETNRLARCKWRIVGTAADSAVAAAIAEGFSNVEDLTGRTSLAGLIDVLLASRSLLTNDTGTMHLADFLGVPLVAIFGSTEPALTGPRRETSLVVREQVECSPCFLRECPIDFRCMREVRTDEVVAKLCIAANLM